MIGGGRWSWGRRGVEGCLKLEGGGERQEMGGIWSLRFVQIAVVGEFLWRLVITVLRGHTLSSSTNTQMNLDIESENHPLDFKQQQLPTFTPRSPEPPFRPPI